MSWSTCTTPSPKKMPRKVPTSIDGTYMLRQPLPPTLELPDTGGMGGGTRPEQACQIVIFSCWCLVYTITNLTNLDTPEFVNGPVLCITISAHRIYNGRRIRNRRASRSGSTASSYKRPGSGRPDGRLPRRPAGPPLRYGLREGRAPRLAHPGRPPPHRRRDRVAYGGLIGASMADQTARSMRKT